jgi:hypothetical protein
MYDLLVKLFSDGEILTVSAGVVFLVAGIIKFFYFKKMPRNIFRKLLFWRFVVTIFVGVIFIWGSVNQLFFDIKLSPVTDYLIICLLIINASNVATQDFLILEGLK